MYSKYCYDLSKKQREVVDHVLSFEIEKRHHIVLSLVGAHSHGFASPDSDVDLKGVHVLRQRCIQSGGLSGTNYNIPICDYLHLSQFLVVCMELMC